jgi:hypothetical protein
MDLLIGLILIGQLNIDGYPLDIDLNIDHSSQYWLIIGTD